MGKKRIQDPWWERMGLVIGVELQYSPDSSAALDPTSSSPLSFLIFPE